MFPASTKTLVVDDMLTMRKIVRNCLKDLGLTHVTEASDGQQAWVEIEKADATDEPYEFIVSDWNMPNMNGLDLLKKVRADEKIKSIPFILLTAEAEKSQVLEAVNAGVSGYVVKPFTPAVFTEKIKAVYSNAGKK